MPRPSRASRSAETPTATGDGAPGHTARRSGRPPCRPKNGRQGRRPLPWLQRGLRPTIRLLIVANGCCVILASNPACRRDGCESLFRSDSIDLRGPLYHTRHCVWARSCTQGEIVVRVADVCNCLLMRELGKNRRSPLLGGASIYERGTACSASAKRRSQAGRASRWLAVWRTFRG